MTNSILSNTIGGNDFVNNSGTVTATEPNLVMSGLTGASIITTDPQLAALAANGGLTQTMALSVGSPAINAADNALAPLTDQRGYHRPDSADLGAYEYGPWRSPSTRFRRSPTLSFSRSD